MEPNWENILLFPSPSSDHLIDHQCFVFVDACFTLNYYDSDRQPKEYIGKWSWFLNLNCSEILEDSLTKPPFKVTSPEWISCSITSNTKVTATIREDQITQAIRSNVSLNIQKKYVSNFQG